MLYKFQNIFNIFFVNITLSYVVNVFFIFILYLASCYIELLHFNSQSYGFYTMKETLL